LKSPFEIVMPVSPLCLAAETSMPISPRYLESQDFSRTLIA